MDMTKHKLYLEKPHAKTTFCTTNGFLLPLCFPFSVIYADSQPVEEQSPCVAVPIFLRAPLADQ